jgi:Bardet-Biedl syndrome 7 protein
VLPLGKKNKQKLVLGDSTGQVQALSLGKSLELVLSFKMSPALQGQQAKPINYIDLSTDKIFVASGEVISGITRKGKCFFRLETNLSENISSMAVRTPYIWTAGEYVLNVFEEGREAHFYMSPDKVNHITVEQISDKTLDSVLACNDRMLRVVKNSDLVSEHPVEGAAKTVAVYSTKNNGSNKDIVYGTDSGHLGAFKITSGGLQKKWLKEDEKNTGGINCILVSDFTKDGVSDLICGRDNGFMEIFNFEGANAEPTLIYQTTLNETITSMDTGLITNIQKDEIAVSTYSGKILCFSNHQNDAPPPLIPSSTTSAAAAKTAELTKKRNEKKIQAVTQDIEKLKEKLKKQKAEYGRMSEDHIAVSAEYKIKDKFVLDSSACWILTLELDCPIELAALQCDVDVELIDVDANIAIVSKNKPERDSSTKLLATYRNTESVNRMEIKVRTVEGQYGTLQVFVLPKLSPKTAQLASYQIRPLSLHQRQTEKPAGIDDLSMNTLTMQGPFSFSDMISWMGQCLPDVPEKTQTDEVTYYFKSTFQGTMLVAKIKAGEGVFKSDSVSTLAILKDFITKQATTRKMQVKSPFEIKDDTCANVLQLLHPKLQYQLSLSEKVKLIDALKEIEMQEQDVSFLSEQYKEILENHKSIEKEFEMQPRRLEFLHGIVKNLYNDKYKFKGQNVSHKLPVLQGLLEKYDLKEVQAFFAQS